MDLTPWVVRWATHRRVLAITSRVLRNGALCQGPSACSRVSLTFDDGPHPEWTPRVLDCLDELAITATFFVVGRAVAAFPTIVREARKRGHEIGTHLYHHKRPAATNPAALHDEISRSRDELENALGDRIKWLRFPYGDPCGQSAQRIREMHGLEVVYWTFSAMDSRARTANTIVERVAAGARSGAIILMHDCLFDESEGLSSLYHPERTNLLSALPFIKARLFELGLSTCSLSALFE